jgi:dolichyl-phosphate-mannose-protein mannosyltransferase
MRMPPRPRRFSPELLVLTALAFLTRFWGLLSPREIVWDEVHYERFAGAYFTGNYYIDVHPPLGKLLFAAAAKVLGVSGAALANNEPAPLLRVIPALCGALIIPLVYLLLRELGAGRRSATFGAALLLVDNALLVESRFIFPDVPLLFFGLLAVFLFARSRAAAGSRRSWLISGAAAAAGVAFSIKWTGLSALGLIGLVWVIESLRSHAGGRRLVFEGALLALIPATIYVSAFAVHFALLPRAGPGDLWMSDAFRSTLVGEPGYDPSAHESFTSSFLELNQQMGAINGEWGNTEHAAASKWYTWPIARHSIGYYTVRNAERGSERWIVLFANPIVWWGVIFGALAVIVGWVRRAPQLIGRGEVLAALGVGYLANFLPFAFIQRPMFLYHYFFALAYSVLFVSIGVGALAGWDEESFPIFSARTGPSRLFVAILGSAALLFLYLAPLSYGAELSDAAIRHRRWILERHIGVSTDR